ncbi:UPF0676 protein [Colletotrichum trifolii]|uniref:UPF0676 protein n=1 Tax=Colletotrichum trifolii TaxID=5466 RepID=A0A4V3HW37_COLTR|nr:UPF0676 protein [Colletotrichum trifolii]
MTPSAVSPPPSTESKLLVKPWSRPHETKKDLQWAPLTTIDLSRFDEPGAKQELAKQLYDAITRVGFWVVIGTGIDDEQVLRQFSIGNTFFQEPLEEKRKYPCNFAKGEYFGYRENERWIGDTGVKENIKMLNIHKDIPAWKDVGRHRIIENHWSEIRAFHRDVWEVARKLFVLISIILELPENYLADAHAYDGVSDDHLRYMIYNVRMDEEWDKAQAYSKGGHTDFGSLTLLFSQHVAGLQIKTPEGRWKYVKPVEGSITCNAADTLTFLTNAGGPHIASHFNYYSENDRRRRFLTNLAFICDYTKGGGSTTAVAVEERDDCYVFWVASNEGASNETRQFLEGVLNGLRDVANKSEQQALPTNEALMAKCVAFASKRLKKETKLLCNAAMACSTYLKDFESSHSELSAWLESLKDLDSAVLEACKMAFEQRKDDNLRLIQDLGRASKQGVEPPHVQHFRRVRHMIGRLAAHTRAVEQLIEDSSSACALLDSFRVETVERPPSAPVPPADSHTTLKGILRRLLPANDTRYDDFLGFLSALDEQVGLELKIRDKFEPGKIKPSVHAEVQILHHFYERRLKFAAQDRYIACSKFACICCASYFRHHPARVQPLDCHQKTYTKWGIVDLPQGAKDSQWLSRRKILNDVISDLRAVVHDRISELHSSSRSHPDSLTAITTSSMMRDDEYSEDTADAYSDVDDDSQKTDYTAEPILELSNFVLSDDLIDNVEADSGGVGL